MLIGTFKNNIGDKKRVAFPKKFRNELGSKVIITKGYERCLIVVDEGRWEKLIDSIKQIPFVNSSIRDTRRFLIGSAVEIEMDKQGRFVLPDNLAEYASLGNEACFIGLLDWVEMWDSNVWNEKESDVNEKSQDIANKLSELLTN